MNYYYRMPHEKWETEKEGKKNTLSVFDLSDQKFGLQPSKARHIV